MWKKIGNIASTAAALLVAAAALLLVGIRLAGFQVFTVLSGSMEPTYPTGSLIYVKTVDTAALRVGDVITFMLDEDTVATHRITAIVPDEADGETLRFQTKGDANNNVDAGLVHYKNIIGTPLFAVPYVGYAVNYVRQPPGLYITIAVCAILMLWAVVSDRMNRRETPRGKSRGKRRLKAEQNNILSDK